jgi:molybdopterin molybdotransferase
VSGLQVPPQDNSAMDGYAVRAPTRRRRRAVLPVSQRIPAGAAPQPLQAGTAARIFTGAPVPEGADAIVMQEDTEARRGGKVRILQRAGGRPVDTRSGEDITRGSTVLARGERIGPQRRAWPPASAATAAGRPRPRVALFSTGDELVMPGEVAPEAMKPGAIYNSNRFFLRSLLQRLGCEVRTWASCRTGATPPCRRCAGRGRQRRDPHQRRRLGRRRRPHQARSASARHAGPVADRDEAGQALRARAHWQGAHFIGLPGNPVSSFVTFLLLVRPFLLKLQGASRLAPRARAAAAAFRLAACRQAPRVPARAPQRGGRPRAVPNQSSGVLTSTVWADGLIDNPAGQTIRRAATWCASCRWRPARMKVQ